jgi:hypothetical protein
MRPHLSLLDFARVAPAGGGSGDAGAAQPMVPAASEQSAAVGAASGGAPSRGSAFEIQSIFPGFSPAPFPSYAATGPGQGYYAQAGQPQLPQQQQVFWQPTTARGMGGMPLQLSGGAPAMAVAPAPGYVAYDAYAAAVRARGGKESERSALVARAALVAARVLGA